MARFLRTTTNSSNGHSRLEPPVVVGPGIAWSGPGVRLADPSYGSPNRRATHSELRPPTVVFPAFTPIPGNAHLAVRSTLTQVRARSQYNKLRGPTVVFAAPLAPPPKVTDVALLAPRQLARKAHPKLNPPTVVFPATQPFIARPIKVAFPDLRNGRGRLRRKSHPALFPPAVIGAGIYFRPIRTWLAYSLRGKPKSQLRPPTVVFPPPANFGPAVHITRGRAGKATSKLSPPAVVGAGLAFSGPGVSLTRSPVPHTRSRLSPPTVVAAPALFFGPVVHTTRGRAGKATSRLFPPAVVGAGIVFRPVDVTLAYSLRGKAKSKLFPPAAVGAGIYFYPVRVTLVRGRAGQPKSRLSPPIIPPLAPPIRVDLAPQRRGVPKSHLLPPAVVGAGIYFRGILVKLAPSTDIPRRRRPDSRLQPPTVVQPIGVIFSGPETHLAYSRRGVAVSTLFPPEAVGPGIVFEPISVRLTPSTDIPRRRRPDSKLSPPTVVQPVGVTFYGPKVHLAYSLRGKAKPRLAPPAVVGAGIVFRPIDVTLVRIKPVPTHPELRPPTVVFTATELTISVTLARIRPVLTHPELRPPVVVFLATDLTILVKLVQTRPAPIHSELRPPAVIGAGIYFRGILVRLAPTTDIPQRRRPDSKLFPPAVVASPPAFLPPEIVSLAYQSRGKPRSRLAPPAVVGAGIYFRGILVHLAPSSRGKPKSKLFPPTVVGTPPVPPIRVQLVRGRAGVPKSRLFPPIIPPLARPTDVTLALQNRLSRLQREPYSRLFPPAVVGAGIYFRGIDVELTYSRRGVPKSKLFPPAVIGLPPFRPIDVTFVRGRAGKTRSRLFPPIIPPLARPIDVTLVQLRLERRGPHSVLRPPRVVGQPGFRPAIVKLVRIRPVPTAAILFPPEAVGPGITFRGVLVHLTPSTDIPRRRRPTYRLGGPTAVSIAPPTADMLHLRIHLVAVSDRAARVHYRFQTVIFPPSGGLGLHLFADFPLSAWTAGQMTVGIVREMVPDFPMSAWTTGSLSSDDADTPGDNFTAGEPI